MQPSYDVPLGFYKIAALVVGACVGSFLNVVVARVPLGESIFWPPSHCRSCNARVRPWHNLPVISWLLLRGRCGKCGARFSARYAIVELFFALVCWWAVGRHGLTLATAHEIVLVGFLLPLALIDLDCWILPHVLTRSGIAVGLLLSLGQGKAIFLNRLFAAALGFTALALVGFVAERILKKEAIGGGDPWLVALIGAFLGTRALLPVVFLSSAQGAVIGILMIVARRRREAAASASQPAVPASAAANKPVQPPQACSADAQADARSDEHGEEEWQPDQTAVPFGPFLALAAAEVHYFHHLPSVLFPWLF